MKTNKSKKIIYMVSSVCAVLILCIGIFMGVSNNLLKKDNIQLGEAGSEENNLNVELNINKLKELAKASSDADIKTRKMESLPEKFKFMDSVNIPEGYNLEGSYNIYVREDINVEEYSVLHDYVFDYRENSENSITIAFSEIEEPLRDYFIDGGEKVSKIGETELIISQWKEMYIVTFEYKGIYFDIETTGVTENELVDLLKSIIEEQAYFFGKVIESTAQYILVEPNEGEEIRKSADKISIGLGENNDMIYPVGTNLKITYTGEIMESYPAQIKATNIEAKSADEFELKVNELVETTDNKLYKILGKEENETYDYDIYCYNVNVEIEIDGNLLSLRDALLNNKITMNEILEKANKDLSEGKITVANYKDGGSRLYKYDDYTILKCHTIDGNRDVYFGTPEMTINDVK